MPTEPIDMIASRVPEGVLDTRTGLRRDILLVFNTWHNELLTAERIKILLETKGHSVKMETLYDNLETLVRKDILIKKAMPSTGFKGRPPYFYEINSGAVYDQFELLDDLLDACGFDPISCDESGNAYVEKLVCMIPNEDLLLPGFERVRSIRNAFDGGQLGNAIRLADSEDFEKTWRLEKFIKKLEERCKTDSPAYIEFREEREYQEAVKAFKRHGINIPPKENIIHKEITIHGTGPLIFHADSTDKPED